VDHTDGDFGTGHTLALQSNGESDSRLDGLLSLPAMDFEDESTWLRHRVLRLRTILRYAKDARVERGLRELIGEAEQRLEQLEARQNTKAPMTGSEK
jgi:hypothetical protein